MCCWSTVARVRHLKPKVGVIARYSRFADGHRSKLLNSHLHTRRVIADPVLSGSGISAKVRRCVVIAAYDAAALAVERPHRKLTPPPRCSLPHIQHVWLEGNHGPYSTNPTTDAHWLMRVFPAATRRMIWNDRSRFLSFTVPGRAGRSRWLLISVRG